jgi:phage shock protein C
MSFDLIVRGVLINMSTRITKSKTDKVIDGVCGGLAEYFGIDSVLVRLVFVLLVFINGLGLILYIILAIIMPKAEKLDQSPKETIRENVQEIGERVKEAGEGLGAALSKKTEEKPSHRGRWLGVLLILLGVFFLLDNLHMIRWIDKDLLWPIIIIFIGAWLLIKRWR